mgnify:CR=1 FL=1
MGVHTLRSTAIRSLAGAALCVLLGWLAFARGPHVPLLSAVDLALHEFGHVAAFWLPELATAMAGSVVQVLVPLAIAAYFGIHLDALGAGLCLAWAGVSAGEVAVYVADAPTEALQLIGGRHDWAFALGPEGLDRLDQAGSIAAVVRGTGLALVVAGAVVCALPLVREAGRRVAARPGSVPRL